VKRRIVGFHRDDERHWVAELECGHGQHVRHDPVAAPGMGDHGRWTQELAGQDVRLPSL
jgi:hypothetical protein